MKKLLLAASTLMFLTACDPFEGVLSVKQPLSLQVYDGKQYTQVVLPAGDLNAKFEQTSKNEIQIKTQLNGKKQTLRLITAKKLDLPQDGDFSIPAADLAQVFNAVGHSDTRVTDGGIHSDYESCTYQRRETRCFTDQHGHPVCQDYWVTVYGRQFVEYQLQTTDKSITVNFERDGNVLATLAGAKSFTEKFIRFQGQCY
jgi:hypothetical protein